MCLAIPGRITAVEQGVATVDYGTEIRMASIVTGRFAPGDYVIVQGGIIVMGVPAEDAQRWEAFYRATGPGPRPRRRGKTARKRSPRSRARA